MKIVTIIGARPQFVKCAVVSRKLRKVYTEVIVHTGQHYDEALSDVFFRELQIPAPDYQLDVGSNGHGAQTGRMLERVEQVLLAEKPDYVLVYGDTNSTLAGALAASKLDLPVAHVEAGLRSFNRRMPEEINRIVTDHLATLNFCSTKTAFANLRGEGIHRGVHLVGDVMYDAVLYYRTQAVNRSTILQRLGLQPRDHVVATVHRAENTDDPQRLTILIDGMIRLAQQIRVVFPVHPRTKLALQRQALWPACVKAFECLDPVGYFDMLQLQSSARLVVTDSGGIQKEAYFCGTPCATLRDETEWVELLDLGWNRLISPRACPDVGAALLQAISEPFPDPATSQPYGNGNAVANICKVISATASSRGQRFGLPTDSPIPAALVRLSSTLALPGTANS